MKNQNSINVKIEVIQGGLCINQHPDVLPTVQHKLTNKTDVKHLNGTILMARNEPISANSEIFICINDQPELDWNGSRNPDGLGFTVLEIDIVKKIH